MLWSQTLSSAFSALFTNQYSLQQPHAELVSPTIQSEKIRKHFTSADNEWDPPEVQDFNTKSNGMYSELVVQIGQHYKKGKTYLNNELM